MAGIKFTIDAENRSAAAVGQAIQGVQRYEAELRKLKAAGDQSTDGQTRLGQAVLNVAQAKQRAAQATRTLTQGQSALTEAARGATAALGAQAGPLGGLVTSLSGVNLAAGLAAGGIAAFGVVAVGAAKAVGDYQERMALAAASTGLATRDIAGLTLAAAETGRSFEQVRPALDFFTRRIGEAATGSKEAIGAFAALGVSIRTSSGDLRETGDVFRDVQSALSELAAGPERAKVAFELFGRGASASLGALLTPLDEAIALAERFGIAFSQESQRTAEAADTALDRMGAAFQGFGLRVSLALAPIGTAIANSITSALVGLEDSTTRVDSATVRMNAELHESWLRSLRVAAGFDNAREAHDKYIESLQRKALEGREGGGPGANLNILTGVNTRQSTAGTVGGLLGMAATLAAGVGPVETFRKAVDKFASSIPSGTGIFGNQWGMSPVRDEMDAFSPFVSKLQPGYVPPPFTPTVTPDIPGTGFNEDMFEGNKAIKTLANTLENSFSGFISDAIRGVGSLSEAMNGLLLSAADILIQAGVSGLLKSIGIPLQSGGTIASLQTGGTISFDNSRPIRAQSGLVVSGVRGRDTVPALLGKGETVIDHSLTDSLRALIPKLDGFVRGGRASGGDTFAPTINLTVNEAQLRGRRLEDYLSDELIPRMDEARRSGRLRR